LIWDIADTKPWSRLTRLADLALSPVIGKSIVIYAAKPTREDARTPAPPFRGRASAAERGDAPPEADSYEETVRP
jgi:hypothetical protein